MTNKNSNNNKTFIMTIQNSKLRYNIQIDEAKFKMAIKHSKKRKIIRKYEDMDKIKAYLYAGYILFEMN